VPVSRAWDPTVDGRFPRPPQPARGRERRAKSSPCRVASLRNSPGRGARTPLRACR